MQNLPAWETQHFQGSYQEYGVGIGYRSRDSISPGKIRSYKYQKNFRQKMQRTYPLPSRHLIIPVLPWRWRSAIILWVLISTSQLPWGASNAKIMDATGKPVEKDRMCKMRWNRFGLRVGRLLERNYMCKLPTRSSGLSKILRRLKTKKRK